MVKRRSFEIVFFLFLFLFLFVVFCNGKKERLLEGREKIDLKKDLRVSALEKLKERRKERKEREPGFEKIDRFGEKNTKELFPSSSSLSVWPLPQTLSQQTCGFVLHPCFQIYTKSTSKIIKEGIERYHKLIFSHGLSCSHPISPPENIFEDVLSRVIKDHTFSHSENMILGALQITIESELEELTHNVDESYEISLPQKENKQQKYRAKLSSKTVWGALRGLETFSQYVMYNVSNDQYVLPAIPLEISDFPRFKHRGFHLDTSRHYIHLVTIKRLLDAMSYSKLNVLHWHITDSQSFPLHLKQFPRLIQGAWSQRETYGVRDVREIISYAQKRGIRVYFEADAPSHARAWGIGEEELLPKNWKEHCESKYTLCPPLSSGDCNIPLDPSKNQTFQTVKEIYRILAILQNEREEKSNDFDYSYKMKKFAKDSMGLLHTGGDEITYKCWETPAILDWMKKEHFSSTKEVFRWFLMRQYEFAKELGQTPVSWEEVYGVFQKSLPQNVIVHGWLNSRVAEKAAADGYNVLWSQGYYLDHRRGWETYFQHQIGGKFPPKNEDRYIGGETCLWSERVDDANFDAVVWPAAAAVAERLWSHGSTANNMLQARMRMRNFRCLLLSRGIGATAPNRDIGEDPPFPSSCYWDIGSEERPSPISIKQCHH